MPASMRRRQRGSLSRQAGRRGIAATRRDSATDAPHSGHFPSGGWAQIVSADVARQIDGYLVIVGDAVIDCNNSMGDHGLCVSPGST